MGFSRQENWSGLPFPSPGDVPDLGVELASLIFLEHGDVGLLVGCGDLLGEGDEKQNPPHFLQLASEHLAAGEGIPIHNTDGRGSWQCFSGQAGGAEMGKPSSIYSTFTRYQCRGHCCISVHVLWQPGGNN